MENICLGTLAAEERSDVRLLLVPRKVAVREDETDMGKIVEVNDLTKFYGRCRDLR